MDSAQRARSCASKKMIEGKIEWLKKNKIKVIAIGALVVSWFLFIAINLALA